jgi:hypothetical protein
MSKSNKQNAIYPNEILFHYLFYYFFYWLHAKDNGDHVVEKAIVI